MLLVFGPRANCFGRQPLNPNWINVTSEDTNLPRGNLVDGYPDTPFREAAATADHKIYSDLTLTSNYDMETNNSGVPLGWSARTSGTGTMTRTTTAGEFDTGAAAMECTGGSGFGEGYQRIFVKPGERLRYEVRARVVTAGTARVRIRNLTTMRYLTSGGAWQLTATDAATRTGTTFGALNNDFTVESFTECMGNPLVELEIIGRHDNGSGSACFDGFRILPYVNFVAAFGHNMMPAPTIISADPSATITVPGTFAGESNFVVPSPLRRAGWWSYYVGGVGIAKAFVGIQLNGTHVPESLGYIGEFFLGQARTPGRAAKWGFATPARHATTRMQTGLGRTVAVRQSAELATGIRLSFRQGNEADSRELIEEVWGGCGGGVEPIIVVPVETEGAVYHGRVVSPALEATRGFLTSWEQTLDIEGSAMPVVGL